MQRLTDRRGARSLAFAMVATAIASCGSHASDGNNPLPVAVPVATSTPPPSNLSATPSTSLQTRTASSCTGKDTGPPAGAANRPVVDVDGDSTPDTGWMQPPDASGNVVFGVTTSEGATLTAPSTSGDTQAQSVLFARVAQTGPVVAIVLTKKNALLYRVVDCQLKPVKNVEGQQYAFDIGLGPNGAVYGTGVGCSAVAGGATSVVGLLTEHSQTSNTIVDIKRTAVLINGDQARNGPTDTVPATDEAITSATIISCGDLTNAKDGVRTTFR